MRWSPSVEEATDPSLQEPSGAAEDRTVRTSLIHSQGGGRGANSTAWSASLIVISSHLYMVLYDCQKC